MSGESTIYSKQPIPFFKPTPESIRISSTETSQKEKDPFAFFSTQILQAIQGVGERLEKKIHNIELKVDAQAKRISLLEDKFGTMLDQTKKEMLQHQMQIANPPVITMENMLIWGALHGDTALVLELARYEGFKVNELYVGYNVLHYALAAGHEETAIALLKNGAKVCNNTDLESVKKILLQKKFDINELNDKGYNLLHYAASFDNVEMVQTLLEHGANPQILSDGGSKAIHFAAESRCIPMFKKNLELGFNVDDCTEYDWTPLHFAARKGDALMVNYILSCGANVNSLTKAWDKVSSDWTPLHVAADYNMQDAIVELLQANPDLSLKTEELKTALEIAQAKGHTYIIKLLENHLENKLKEKGFADAPVDAPDPKNPPDQHGKMVLSSSKVSSDPLLKEKKD